MCFLLDSWLSWAGSSDPDRKRKYTPEPGELTTPPKEARPDLDQSATSSNAFGSPKTPVDPKAAALARAKLDRLLGSTLDDDIDSLLSSVERDAAFAEQRKKKTKSVKAMQFAMRMEEARMARRETGPLHSEFDFVGGRILLGARLVRLNYV